MEVLDLVGRRILADTCIDLGRGTSSRGNSGLSEDGVAGPIVRLEVVLGPLDPALVIGSSVDVSW